MTKKVKDICKKALVFLMCVITFSSAIFSSISYAKASSSYSQLGTNYALGSPVLNNNFTTDQWNKWETVCWGVFLSNFCVPLVDNYVSAFSSGHGGSDGSGYKALVFATGNDSANNEVIEEFCNYAVVQQESSGVQLYVTYSYVKNDTIEVSGTATYGQSSIRAAKFQDLFMIQDTVSDSDDVLNNVSNVKSTYKMGATISKWNLHATGSTTGYIMNTYEGTFPTFWVKVGDTYEKVFDYTDPWDIQISTLMISKALSSDRADDFYSSFKKLYDANSDIKFDCFGNIVTDSDNKMIIPASTNKHLTKSESINLVNSFVMNGNSSSISNDNLIEGVTQYIDTGIAGYAVLGAHGAAPALGGKDSKIKEGATYIYYDSDNVLVTENTNNLGETYINLFDNSDINAKNQKYNLKIEAANVLKDNAFLGLWMKDSGTNSEKIAQNQMAASLLSTYITSTNQSSILTKITLTDGSTLDIFSDTPVAVNPQINGSGSDDAAAKTKQIYNFIYQCYSGNISQTSLGSLSPESIKSSLGDIDDGIELGKFVEKSNIWDTYKLVKGLNKSEKYKATTLWDYCGNESFDVGTSRLLIMYPTSEVFRAVSNVLGIVEGTEFSLYSTYIYITYLDFYGVTHSTDLLGDTDQTSDFKEELFGLTGDVLNFDPADTLGSKSEDELEKETLEYAYLMLSPSSSSGRAYRTEIVTNAITDFIYDNYTKMTSGTATTDAGNIFSKSDSGFLYIQTYSDNFLTKWFVDGYSNVALILIMVMIVLMIIVGLIRGKKVSWYAITLLVIVNTVLILPSTGELVPYFTQQMVQKLFTSKMTFWAISEAISNQSLETDAVTQSGELSGLSADDAAQIAKLVKSLNVVYLDRSLTVKRDISAKITQKLSGTYSEIQNIASARWLLPTIMRQYSQENSGADYVYISLGDLYDDMSNMYWFFDPSDASLVNTMSATLTSGQNNEATSVASISGVSSLSDFYTKVTSKFTDYVDLVDYDDKLDDSVKVRNISFQSASYENVSSTTSDGQKLIHNYSYIMDDVTVLTRDQSKTAYGNKFSDITAIYEDRLNSTTMQGIGVNSWDNKLSTIESVADQYDRSDRSTIQKEYAYLWATESPAHYFYTLVKDTFSGQDQCLASLIGRLQGEYDYDKNDKLVRKSLMHATETLDTGDEVATGYVRDVLDLQSLFSNLVPYLYQTQITAGGMDGSGGMFSDGNGGTIKISDDLSLYEGQDASWLFRSNWAVKIMECPEYNKQMTVKDKDGNKYTISNPILPECYPDARPMVYSEAQMYAMGLNESDLNVVELKCIEANNSVVDKWTLLINYAGTSNLTMEVLERQMALDATLIFDEEFSPSGVFNSSYAMYPQTVDLRNISFDSIMKMIMLNVSQNTSYIYGNTMSTLIANSDLLTAMLLLAVTWLCANFIPFMRTFLMAEIFYLGFVAILKAIFADNKFKTKVACGQMLTNVVFLMMTYLYYLVFYMMINITSSDEVLHTSQRDFNTGSPVWSLIIILVASLVYCLGIVYMINFCFKNYRDMGMEVYGMIAHSTTERLKSGVNGIRADLGKKASQDAAAQKQNEKTGTEEGNANKKKGGSKGGGNIDVSVTTEASYDPKTKKFTTTSKYNASTKSAARNDEKSTYNEKANEKGSADANIASDIDSKIKKGAEQGAEQAAKAEKAESSGDKKSSK